MLLLLGLPFVLRRNVKSPFLAIVMAVAISGAISCDEPHIGEFRARGAHFDSTYRRMGTDYHLRAPWSPPLRFRGILTAASRGNANGAQTEVKRKTKETDIRLTLDLDGTGKSEIMTGVGFFDHMLTLLSAHSGFDLEVKASGDTHVDYHHTVEDVGIALGQALKDALGDKAGIERYGWAMLPMDEAMAQVALDLGGRPYIVYNVTFPEREGRRFRRATRRGVPPRRRHQRRVQPPRHRPLRPQRPPHERSDLQGLREGAQDGREGEREGRAEHEGRAP